MFSRCADKMTFNGYTIIGGTTSVADFDEALDDGTRTLTIPNIQYNGEPTYRADQYYGMRTLLRFVYPQPNPFGDNASYRYTKLTNKRVRVTVQAAAHGDASCPRVLQV